MRFLHGFIPIMGLALGLLGPAEASQDKPLTAFVSVQPQATFVQRLASPHVAVLVLVPAGSNHENYEPTPRQIQQLSGADLYFRVGMPFEEVWMKKIQANNRKLTVVDTRRNVPMLQITAHDHNGLDPHIWLDPQLVKIQARTMAEALEKADPAHTGDYRKNLGKLEQELDALDQRLRAVLAPVANRSFLVFHPAWGYFAKAYGLNQIAIEAEGKEPGPRSLERVIQNARAKGIKTIFVQRPFSSRSVEMVAQAIGGKIVPLDPMAPDYFENMVETARAIAEGQ